MTSRRCGNDMAAGSWRGEYCDAARRSGTSHVGIVVLNGERLLYTITVVCKQSLRRASGIVPVAAASRSRTKDSNGSPHQTGNRTDPPHHPECGASDVPSARDDRDDARARGGAAGVSRGAIYWHFENKKALFDAMRSEVCLPTLDRTDVTTLAAGTNGDDPLRAIERFITGLLAEVTSCADTRQTFEIMAFKCEYVAEFEKELDLHRIKYARDARRAGRRLSPRADGRCAARRSHAEGRGHVDAGVRDGADAPVAAGQQCRPGAAERQGA